MPGKKSGNTEGRTTHSPTHMQTHTHHAASTARVVLLPAELGILGKYTKISLIVLFAFQQKRKKDKES